MFAEPAYPIPELAELAEWKTFKPGLARTARALKLLGHPERTFPHVLIGGTNGKGSVSNALACRGPRGTGLFISPHVEDIRERITVDGEWIPDEAWRSVYRYIQTRTAGETYSFFEWNLLLAVQMFAEREVPFAVFEVGLGGRLDATNTLSPLLSAVVSVGLDHTAILGDTVQAIAKEKVMIARAGKPMFVPASIAADPLVQPTLAESEADVRPFKDTRGVEDNDRVVDLIAKTLPKLGIAMRDADHVEPRRLPARRELLRQKPPLWLDGAHNEDAWRDLATWFNEPIRVIAGLTEGRDPAAFLNIVEPIASEVCILDMGYTRQIPLDQWPRVVRRVEIDELASLLEEPLLVTGSLYAVGAFRRWFKKNRNE